MLIEQYDSESWLFNVNFKEKATDDVMGYRGELILIKGEIADDLGRTKPPIAIMRHTILLEEAGKLVFIVGIIDRLELVNNFLDVYKKDFSPDVKILLYVVNLTKEIQLSIDGVNIVMISLREGVAWNELIDELGMEKSDFKGQSPAAKIVTAYEEFKAYKTKSPVVSYDEATELTADIKWEAQGAV